MPKINKEEYEVLKALDSRAKSIVRQARGWLWVAEQPIMKDETGWYVENGFDAVFENEDDNLFHFIQWEDREPYNIAELIEEYEEYKKASDYFNVNIKNVNQSMLDDLPRESKETEVKKDIEWLKKEIGTEMIELESHRAERWSDVKYQTLRSVAQKIDQLDEPEVLSQEWIDENKEARINNLRKRTTDNVVPVDKLENLIIPKQEITEEQVMDWLDKNDFYDHITAETVLETAVDKGELSYYGTKYSVIETPTIPKYVAEFLELVRSDVSLMLILEVASTRRERSKWEKEYDWISENSETFARAWLDGYTVEEPLYYALIKGHELVNDEVEWATKYWNLWVSEGCVFPYDKSETTDDFSIVMSKSEWNKWGINDSNADFVSAEEVEE